MVFNIEQQTKLRVEVKKDVEDPSLQNRSTPFMRQMRYMYVELMLSTGLRISEAMGLQWKDIVATTEKREGKVLYVLHVHRSIEVDGTYKSTKTSKDRRVPLSLELTEKLFAHKKFLAEYSEYYEFKDNGLVFPKDDGEVYLSRNMANTIRDLFTRIGLHGGSHTMRHTAITNWLSGSKNIKLAQTLAGHANIAMTLDTYGHVLEENVMDSIDDLYKTLELTRP
jgi:integrase